MEYRMTMKDDPNNTLFHWGIKGQKWGERRYQNEDGSLTPEGRIRYGYSNPRNVGPESKTGETPYEELVTRNVSGTRKGLSKFELRKAKSVMNKEEYAIEKAKYRFAKNDAKTIIKEADKKKKDRATLIKRVVTAIATGGIAEAPKFVNYMNKNTNKFMKAGKKSMKTFLPGL